MVREILSDHAGTLIPIVPHYTDHKAPLDRAMANL